MASMVNLNSRCLKLSERLADGSTMFPRGLSDSYQIYLWRSIEAPGTLYLAESAAKAESFCRELVAEGYIVKVIQTATDVEYEIRQGSLVPVKPLAAPVHPQRSRIARPRRQTAPAPA